MRRPHIAFAALGFVFVGLAATGRSQAYYGIAAVFFVLAFVIRGRNRTK